MNIFIKCSSRPFYLDRLLHSIEMNCTGTQAVILLNDGIAARHVERLKRTHRGVEERRSGRLAANPAADPGAFWAAETAAEGRRYIFVLEEDTWITSPIDLDAVERALARNHALMMRMYWHGADAFAAAARIQFSEQAEGGVALDFYSKVDAKSFLDLYNYFCVAHGVFRADFYSQSYAGLANWADEMGLLRAAVGYINTAVARGEKFRLCKSRIELLRHSTTTTSRTDSGGAGIAPIDARAVNDALTESWDAGDLDVMAGYPSDIPEAAVARAIARRLGDAALDQWRVWRHGYLGMYENMGARL